MARQFKIAPKVSVEYVAPAPVKRAPAPQPIPQVKRVSSPKVNNAYASWTDSALLRKLTLDKPSSCETRVVLETHRIKESLRTLLLFVRDVEQNLDLRERNCETAATFIKQASDLIQYVQDEMVEELARKQGR